MRVRIHIMLKNGVLDPQGKAIANALNTLGFKGINEVRQGKVIYINFDEADPTQAKINVDSMCEKLLANSVIESYEIELME
jgi:phosphoribosylformylglycinamidine synthase PurS subunit